MRIRGASFDHTNPSTEVHRRPETSTDFVRRWRTIGARFGPSSSQAVPISWFPYGVPGGGRRGPCLRVGRGGLEAARPRRGGYALARVFVTTLAAPADGVRMLVCPSPTPPDADARGIFLEHLPITPARLGCATCGVPRVPPPANPHFSGTRTEFCHPTPPNVPWLVATVRAFRARVLLRSTEWES